MPEESIFDILQPRERPGGIRGALGSGVRGLSDFFQAATPALLADEEVGFGGAFAAGLLGSLAQPQRQAEAQRAQRREQAMQVLPQLFDRLAPGSQQQFVSAVAPGAELAPPAVEPVEPSEAELAVIQAARDALGNEDLDSDTRNRAAATLMALDPTLEQRIGGLLQDWGVEPSEERQFTFLSQLMDDYTAGSVGQFEDTGFEDWSVLVPKPDDETGTPGAARDHRALTDLNRIKAYQRQQEQEGTPVSDKEAADALGITGLDWSNVQRFVGVSTASPGAISYAQLFLSNMDEILQNDLGVTLEEAFSGAVSPGKYQGSINKAKARTDAQAQGLAEVGIRVPTQPGVSGRAAQAFGIQQEEVEAERENMEILREYQRRRAEGDTRTEDELIEAIIREREGQ